VINDKFFFIFINKLALSIIRSKLVKVLESTIIYFKLNLNLNFFFFLFEAISKIKPIMGAYIFIIEKKKKKTRQLYPYILTKDNRFKKALS